MSRPEYIPRFIEDATTIRRRMLDNIPDTWRKEEGDFPYDAIRANPGEIIQLEMQQDRILQNAFPQFCEADLMDDHLQLRGLNLIEATYSQRTLTITADPGVRIPKGYTCTSVVLDNDGNPIEFTANLETIFEQTSTTIDVRITCKLPGLIGNIANGSEFVLQPPIPGVRSIVDKGIVAAGAEREGVNSAWERYLFKVQNPDTGGNMYDYKRWVIDNFAKDYGIVIKKVIVESCWNGRGTVRVVAVGSDYRPLSEEVTEMLQQYLDPVPYQGQGHGKAPGGAFVTVATGVTKPIDISATVTYGVGVDPAAILAIFKAAAVEYVQSRVFEVDPKTKDLYPIAYNKIGAILGSIEGVENYGDLTINGGTSDIVLQYFDVPEVGTVVLT